MLRLSRRSLLAGVSIAAADRSAKANNRGIGLWLMGKGGIPPAAFGVNLSGAQYFSYAFPSTSDLDYLKSKGISLVRIAIAWENIQPTLLTALNSTYSTALLSTLSAMNSRRIKAIIDIHNGGCYVSTGWGTTYTEPGNNGNVASGVNVLGDSTLTSAAFSDLWTRLATLLVGNPAVAAYELMNEPTNGVIGTNLLKVPNYFEDQTGNWFAINGSVVTQLGAGTNFLGDGYSPAWSITSASFYGGVDQQLTLANTPYILSVYAKVASGTGTLGMAIGGAGADESVSTTWARKTFTATPSAGLADIKFTADVTTAQTIEICNAQLELGSTASAYQPSAWAQIAQPAITAIRAVDVAMPIHVDGLQFSSASYWPQYNYENGLLTGGNLVHHAHQYFDGSPPYGGGGGYAENYSAISGLSASAGVTDVAAYLNWLTETGASGFIGEFGIPNSTADNNAAWFPLQDAFLKQLQTSNLGGTAWFFGNDGGQTAVNLNIAPQSGVDDPRFLQIIEP